MRQAIGCYTISLPTFTFRGDSGEGLYYVNCSANHFGMSLYPNIGEQKGGKYRFRHLSYMMDRLEAV